MNAWIDDNPQSVIFTLSVLSAVFAVLTIVVLTLWLSARSRGRQLVRERSEAVAEVVDLELALGEQRARVGIARELLDLGIRSQGALIRQAEGAAYTAESDPEATGRLLRQLVQNGQGTLGDLRRVTTVLRDDEKVAAIRPSSQSIEELFQAMSDEGLKINFAETGNPFVLRPGPDVTVARIVQLALQNSLRHGGVGTEVQVNYVWTEDGVRVQIDDDGVRASLRRAGIDPNKATRGGVYSIADDASALTHTSTGKDVSEMRERAELYGGVLDVQAVPGVGYSVSVAFPRLRLHNGVHGVDLGNRG